MAKKPAETSLPLIFALVFFVLTTIAFGVMWYLAYSEQEKLVADKKKAETDLKGARDSARDAELAARVYRTYLGINDEDDTKTITAEAKDPKISAELKKLNEAMAKKVGVADVASLPDDFKFWMVDDKGQIGAVPTEGLTELVAKLKARDAVYAAAEKERKAYADQISLMAADMKALKDVKAKFDKEIAKIAPDFDKMFKEVTGNFDKRVGQFQAAEAASGTKISTLSEDNAKLERENKKLKDKVGELLADVQALNVKVNKKDTETFTYDEPQGKILRKLPEGVVEINLGSAANVRPGLTFTILPPDFPEKGRQSRMRSIRMPDAKGEYKPVEMFVPKGSIEVYEVVNANLSLARIVPGSELDPIRDGVAVGDLLYNSVWRKGVADHIALIGIFDVNGDGTDDITSVIRDLTKMGIPVDAYYDMKKRQWVGTVTERTRYIVEGYFPLNSINDPNREEKTKLLASMTAAGNEGKQKGVATVNFRDFFSRMGYKFRLDVGDDKINQATAPYLSNVGVGDPLTPPPPP